jgi:hypothetical protein
VRAAGRCGPGWTRSTEPFVGSIATWIVRERSCAEIPGGDALARLDRDGERGLERRLVVLGHLAQAELVAALLGERQADQPARVGGHEVDRLGRRELRGESSGRPSFSRSAASTTTTNLPWRMSSIASSIAAKVVVLVRGLRHRPEIVSAVRELLDVLGENVDLEIDLRRRPGGPRAW